MPVAYTITWEPHGVCRNFTGVATGKDLLDGQKILHGDSRYYDTKYEILDFLEATDCTITSVDAENHLANHIGAATTVRKRVVGVVATHPRIIALAEGYGTHPASPQPLKLFSTVEDARAWIAGSRKS